MRIAVALVVMTLAVLAPPVFASGHGPVFGFATPLNSQGETSFDLGVFGRTAAFGSQTSLKTMVSYGITPHLQLSAVLPAFLQQGQLPMSMMAGGEFQGNAAWRFQHNPNAVGRRLESTASVGIVAPGPQDSFAMFRGMRSAPGVNAWIASGMASRSHYVWLGGGTTHFAARAGDQRPNLDSASLVYGYRPPSWRADQHQWDWRVFVEMVGEHAGLVRRAGAVMSGSDANQIVLGPTVLGIFKTFAISGGVQFPVYSDLGRMFPHERMRLAVNVSYFLFSHKRSH